MDGAWGDENVPCFVVKIPPGFILPDPSRGLVRDQGGWVEILAFGAGSKFVCARALRFCTKSNPPFPESPRCRSFEEATNWRGKWWVGLRARLSGHLFQEKLNWRQHLGIDPPTLRFRTSPCRLPRGGNKSIAESNPSRCGLRSVFFRSGISVPRHSGRSARFPSRAQIPRMRESPLGSGGVALESARGEPESRLPFKSRRRGGRRRPKFPNLKPQHLDGTRTPMQR